MSEPFTIQKTISPVTYLVLETTRPSSIRYCRLIDSTTVTDLPISHWLKTEPYSIKDILEEIFD